MNEYMKKKEFEERCKAQGLKEQNDGSWARDGHYKERVNFNTNTGMVNNGNGSDKRAYVSTLEESIKKASGK